MIVFNSYALRHCEGGTTEAIYSSNKIASFGQKVPSLAMTFKKNITIL